MYFSEVVKDIIKEENMKVYRVQDRNGTGVFRNLNIRKNEHHSYIEHDEELMESLRARFPSFETKWDDLPSNWVFGCRSVEEISLWFGSGHNIGEISYNEYMIFVGDVPEGEYYLSKNQVLFNREKADLKLLLVDGDKLEDLEDNEWWSCYFEMQLFSYGLT